MSERTRRWVFAAAVVVLLVTVAATLGPGLPAWVVMLLAGLIVVGVNVGSGR